MTAGLPPRSPTFRRGCLYLDCQRAALATSGRARRDDGRGVLYWLKDLAERQKLWREICEQAEELKS